jgi:hypothetical protein
MILKGAIMSKLAQLMFGAAVAANIGITAALAAAPVGGGAPAPAAQSGTVQPADSRGGDRSGHAYHNGGARQDDSASEHRSDRGYRDNDRGHDGGPDRGYRDNDPARNGYAGRVGYGGRVDIGGFGGRNGYEHSAPGYGYGGYRNAPYGYGPGPARYAGWANAGFYAPVVALPLPAYHGWGLGYGYVGAPVVVVAPVYGWAYRR